MFDTKCEIIQPFPPPHPSSTPVPMVVPTQRHKSRCPSTALYGSTKTFITSYIILR